MPPRTLALARTLAPDASAGGASGVPPRSVPEARQG
jgi:hypothetical protein